MTENTDCNFYSFTRTDKNIHQRKEEEIHEQSLQKKKR